MHLQKEAIHRLQLVIRLLSVVIALFTFLSIGLFCACYTISLRGCTAIDYIRPICAVIIR